MTLDESQWRRRRWAARRAAATTLLDHYEKTHGPVGEHDHHCHMAWHRPEPPCTCGWSAAEECLRVYDAVEQEYATWEKEQEA